MPDNLTPEDRRKTMQAVKGAGTGLERRLFAMLAGKGLRGWKKNIQEVLGKPDVAFIEQRIAIFVDGCFWHGCPDADRKLPETNRDYWERKIASNRERDLGRRWSMSSPIALRLPTRKTLLTGHGQPELAPSAISWPVGR